MIARCILAWFFCAAICTAEESRSTVAFSALPAAVQKAVQKLGGTDAADFERVEVEGEVSYDGEITASGRKREISFGEDGTLLSIELAFNETPPAVQKTVRAVIGAGGLVSIYRTFDGGETGYDVTMTGKDGQERAFTVEENGTVSSTEVALAETPAAVQKTVTGQVGAGKLGTITKYSDEGITYDVEATAADGRTQEFSVGYDGKMLSIKVTLEETGADVQKTIRGQIGTGKVVRIDKSFEMRKKVQPYEVEAIKDGKPFYFSVGPNGRFLGVDE